MKFFLSLFLILLLPTYVPAAIISAGNLGNCSSITSSTTCVITTIGILEVDHIAVVDIAFDNTDTTDSTSSEITSVTDSAGNIYTAICAFRNGQGGAAAGVGVASYLTKATIQLPVAGTITITFANAITSKTAQAQEYTVAAGNTLQRAGSCQTEAVDGGDPGSMVISGLPSKEYLFTRVVAIEDNGGGFTITPNYSVITSTNADAGTDITSVCLRHERRILTATGETSNPSFDFARDNASVYFALGEVLVSALKRNRQVIVTE